MVSRPPTLPAGRPRLFEFTVGITTAPNSTDQQMNFAVGRVTTTGTAASNPTPLSLDPGDVAAVSTAGITHSAEPTYASTFLIENAMNQRAAFRWVAAPGYEFVVPATAANGVAAKNVAITAAAVMKATLMWFE